MRTPIGRPQQELDTPALLIDLDAMEHNIQAMAAFCAEVGTYLRPHAKTHKCPTIAHKQLQAGAIGITCAKLGEAEIMVDAGVRDILIANQIVTRQKIGRLVRLARHADLMVAVDNADNLDQLHQAAMAADAMLRVVVEIDTGMGRCGVSSGEAVLALAQRAVRMEHIEFAGLMGYEGHAVMRPTFAERKKLADASVAVLTENRDRLASHGIEAPIVTGGGTGTYNITGAHPTMTEIQAGSYVLMDATYRAIEGLAEPFRQALSVLTTVVSCPTEDRVVTDAGLKSITKEFGWPQPKEHPGLELMGLSEEHGRFQLKSGASPRVGDVIELIPTHGCTTINLHDRYYGIRDGVVETVWPVAARGRSQ